MSDETTTDQAEKTVRCRALKTAPMPRPRMRRSEFDLPESEAKRYAARGWLMILDDEPEVAQVGALAIVDGEPVIDAVAEPVVDAAEIDAFDELLGDSRAKLADAPQQPLDGAGLLDSFTKSTDSLPSAPKKGRK